MAHRPEPFNPVERIARDPLQRAILWLVRNNIPFDVAHSLTSDELQAWGIVFSEFDSQDRFNFETNEWERPNAPPP